MKIALLLSLAGLSMLPAPLRQDYAAIPPDPAEEAKRLGAMKVPLAQAIEAAQKLSKGVASSAVVEQGDAGVMVMTYTADRAVRVFVDPATGDILGRENVVANPDKPEEAEKLPDPAVESKRLGELKMTLAQAIDVAQKASKGVAGSATLDPKEPYITVVAYTPEKTVRLVLDAKTGEVKSHDAVPRFPGEPVTGKWTETSSGLKYYDIKVGTGAKPAGPESRVRVHYTGWLVTGKKFDSSVDRQAAFETKLANVIKGWTEGVGGMQVGGKRKLICPAEIAYGQRAVRNIIPAGATLIFDVELLEVVPD